MFLTIRCKKCNGPVEACMKGSAVIVTPCECNTCDCKKNSDQHKYAAADDPNWPYPNRKVLDRKCSACGQEKRMDCGKISEYGVFTCNDCQ